MENNQCGSTGYIEFVKESGLVGPDFDIGDFNSLDTYCYGSQVKIAGIILNRDAFYIVFEFCDNTVNGLKKWRVDNICLDNRGMEYIEQNSFCRDNLLIKKFLPPPYSQIWILYVDMFCLKTISDDSDGRFDIREDSYRAEIILNGMKRFDFDAEDLLKTNIDPQIKGKQYIKDFKSSIHNTIKKFYNNKIIMDSLLSYPEGILLKIKCRINGEKFLTEGTPVIYRHKEEIINGLITSVKKDRNFVNEVTLFFKTDINEMKPEDVINGFDEG
ncbi:MAG: hypothetical protein LWY06_13230 [Firmicutes bacterium]|nr:hypothetical protein [Bacillota bacterium]